MPRKRLVIVSVVLCLVASLLVACDVFPKATYNGGTPVVAVATPAPADQGIALNTWTRVAPGIEIRAEDWKSAGNNADRVFITRLDLSRVHLSVGYSADTPLTMSEWMTQTGARAIINGGYFDTHNRPTGLLIADGHAVGTPYDGFGGMLAVDSRGHVSLRSLHEQPYNPNTERLQQATQSAPMLIVNGKRTTFNANAASQRRSVVAMDKQGRLLLIVSPGQAFSLDELADLLASSDLSIQSALNLDGGASTGLYVHDSDQRQKVTIDAFTTLPIVIVVK